MKTKNNTLITILGCSYHRPGDKMNTIHRLSGKLSGPSQIHL
jgi:hypothetical protein